MIINKNGTITCGRVKAEGVLICVDSEVKIVEEMLEIKIKTLEEIEKVVVTDSQYDGDHHKAWVLDQVMRIIKGDKYEEFIKEYEYSGMYGKPGAEKEYTWDEGIAP